MLDRSDELFKPHLLLGEQLIWQGARALGLCCALETIPYDSVQPPLGRFRLINGVSISSSQRKRSLSCGAIPSL